MIPKRIHYCWLSGDIMPNKFRYCIESWRKRLSGYEFVKWDLERFPLEKSIFVRQAFECKQYAFASDYIRLYALATEGGIYLDCDVEVLNPFDDLLYLPYFVCKENSPQGIEAAVIGAEKGTGWIMKCLEYYNERMFVDDNGIRHTSVLPSVMMGVIDRHYKPVPVDGISGFVESKECVCIFPSDYFSPKNYVTKKITITKNTYCIHHFSGTWQPVWKKMLLRLWLPLSVRYPSMKSLLRKTRV